MILIIFFKKGITISVNVSLFCQPLNIIYQYGAEFIVPRPEAYSEPSRTYKMEPFAKIGNNFPPLIIFAKSFITLAEAKKIFEYCMQTSSRIKEIN